MAAGCSRRSDGSLTVVAVVVAGGGWVDDVTFGVLVASSGGADSAATNSLSSFVAGTSPRPLDRSETSTGVRTSIAAAALSNSPELSIPADVAPIEVPALNGAAMLEPVTGASVRRLALRS